MDSSNLHHHLHDHHTQFLVPSSSSSATISPSCFGLIAHDETTPLQPTSSSINLMNHGNFNPSSRNPGAHHVDVCSREMRVQNDISAPNSLNNSMPQDFGYHQYWGCGDLVVGGGGLNNNNNHSGHDYGSSSSSSDSYPKFTDLLLQSSSVVVNNNNNNNSSLGQDLNMQPTSYDLYSSNMIFPTINVSNLNQHQQQSTLEMNLEALDLFSCGRFDHNNLSNLYRSADNSNFSSYAAGLAQLHHQQQSTHGCRPSSINSTSTKLSDGEAPNFSLIGGNYGGGGDRVIKRAALSEPANTTSFSEPNNLMKPNNNNNNSLSHNPPQKKSRSDSRASCPPFKVRKEKLGDRIAALQQLVAPFGKTDTASVLMEAIGYIKFLQNQVETLSVPYMKASRNKQAERTRHQPMMNSEDVQLDKKEEAGRGLRSRGLCLVPLSCLSYVTDGGGGIWPANFNGA